MEFLSSLPRGTARPALIVFFNVIWPQETRRPVWTWWRPDILYRKCQRRLLGRILEQMATAQRMNCRVLKDLGLITHEDVMDWMANFRIYDSEKARLQAAERVFRLGKRIRRNLPMAEVEPTLKTIHEEYIGGSR